MGSSRALKQHLGNLELPSITPAHLHRYVQKRKNTGVSNATINRDLTTLKHMLTYASETGLIQQNPVEKSDRKIFRVLQGSAREMETKRKQA